MSGQPELLTVAETAQMLRIGQSSVYRLIASGGIEAVRLGTTLRVSRPWLERFIAAGGTAHPRSAIPLADRMQVV